MQNTETKNDTPAPAGETTTPTPTDKVMEWLETADIDTPLRDALEAVTTYAASPPFATIGIAVIDSQTSDFVGAGGRSTPDVIEAQNFSCEEDAIEVADRMGREFVPVYINVYVEAFPAG